VCNSLFFKKFNRPSTQTNKTKNIPSLFITYNNNLFLKLIFQIEKATNKKKKQNQKTLKIRHKTFSSAPLHPSATLFSSHAMPTTAPA